MTARSSNDPVGGPGMSRSIKTLGPGDSLSQAYELMKEHDFHHVPVVDGEELVGLISLGDILLLSTAAEGKNLIIPNKRLDEVMAKNPITCTRNTAIGKVADLMVHHRVNCLPVMNSRDKLVGIITSTDIIKMLRTDSEEMLVDSFPSLLWCI